MCDVRPTVDRMDVSHEEELLYDVRPASVAQPAAARRSSSPGPGTVDDLEWTDDDDAVKPDVRPAAVVEPDVRPAAVAQPAPPAARRSIPGPAGLLNVNVLNHTVTAAPSATSRFFHHSDAWEKIEALMVSGPAAGVNDAFVQKSARAQGVPARMKLKEVIDHCSMPPSVPLRVPLVCVLVKEIGTRESPRDDAYVVLIDDSADKDGIIHAGVFDQFPGLLKVGAACALQNTPALSLNMIRHHLIVCPDCVIHIVSP